MRVAVVGAGLIGQAWAIVFARAGSDVRLWDSDAAAAQRAVELIGDQARILEEQKLLVSAVQLMKHVTICKDVAEMLDGAAYVQENLPERVELKKEIFSLMDALAAQETILASSTSSIPASLFTEGLPGRARCLVAHPVNPPYLIPVVELCGAPWTSLTAIETARDILVRAGQRPVVVRRELEGFVLNRLQGALLREAFRLVESGAISVEDLDTTVKDGLGLRWAFMGPFETIDLNAPGGIADYCARYGAMYESIACEQTSTDSWSDKIVAQVEQQRRERLTQDHLLERRIWRDQHLMALLRHKKAHGLSGD